MGASDMERTFTSVRWAVGSMVVGIFVAATAAGSAGPAHVTGWHREGKGR